MLVKPLFFPQKEVLALYFVIKDSLGSSNLLRFLYLCPACFALYLHAQADNLLNFLCFFPKMVQHINIRSLVLLNLLVVVNLGIAGLLFRLEKVNNLRRIRTVEVLYLGQRPPFR